jgi:hypothetical protein
MNLKGYCFFAKDCPEGCSHVIVIISQDENKNLLLIPISSIKFLPTGKHQYKNASCIYYDAACTFNGDEIKNENGSPIINRPSFARYQWAQETDSKKIISKQLLEIYQYRCRVTDSVLRNLQKGAKLSEELPPIFYKYFPFF